MKIRYQVKFKKYFLKSLLILKKNHLCFMEKHFIDGFPKSTFEENTSNRNTIKHALRNETSLLRVC